jgi:hypothetical protein
MGEFVWRLRDLATGAHHQQRVTLSGLVAHIIDKLHQSITCRAFRRVIDQRHRVCGPSPAFEPPRTTGVRSSEILQKRVHRQFVNLADILGLPNNLGEPLGEAEEAHRL